MTVLKPLFAGSQKKDMSLYADEAEPLYTYPKISSESTGNANWARYAPCLGRSLSKDMFLLHVQIDEDIWSYEESKKQHLKGGLKLVQVYNQNKWDDPLSKCNI